MINRSIHRTVAIIGQGYVGLPLAMALVSSNWSVIGIDLDEDKIQKFRNGISSIEGISGESIKIAVSDQKYHPTTDFSEVRNASTIVICVPTPLNVSGGPELKFLLNAINKIAPYVVDDALLIIESTSFPGTLRKIVQSELDKLIDTTSKSINFAISPERINPGDLRWNLTNTPRIVSGLTKTSSKKAVQFYKTFCNEVIEVDSPEIAEAAKLLENTFRLVNISLVNQFAQVCRSLNLDVNSIIDAASTKPYGFMEFRPGVGVGGHCIPVDPVYLFEWSKESGIHFSILDAAIHVNDGMPEFIFKRIIEVLVGLDKPKVLILGVAYKSGLSDTRESPAAKLLELLIYYGAECEWFDPLVNEWKIEKCTDLNQRFDVAVIVTNQPNLPIKQLLENNVRILDCTNSFRGTEGVISI
jgi:UDP-N-acetyl-D-glucosamine dehydrogenase